MTRGPTLFPFQINAVISYKCTYEAIYLGSGPACFIFFCMWPSAKTSLDIPDVDQSRHNAMVCITHKNTVLQSFLCDRKCTAGGLRICFLMVIRMYDPNRNGLMIKGFFDWDPTCCERKSALSEVCNHTFRVPLGSR